MKRKRSIGLSVGICLLLLGLFSNISVFAAVTEGKAGETLTGEYAVIVNTDPEVAHNTGTLMMAQMGLRRIRQGAWELLTVWAA